MKTENRSADVCLACGAPARTGVRGICSRCVAGALFSDSDDAAESESDKDNFGVRIPGHEVSGKIADTGLSQVYQGWQMEPRREVAIKILRRGGRDDDGLLERFQQEIRIGASLGDHGCVQVFESGFANDAGIFYFTMELMRGGTICEYAEKQALGLEERVRLFLPLCETISAAHRVPILHRDLKPGNVLVTEDGKVKLGDFGLAKFLAEDGEGITLQNGFAPLGTPVYMSPEQARGEAATTLSDVYGLGAVLYELLTDARPFSEEGGSHPTMLRVAERPARDPAGLHSDLKAILGRAMAKSPANRYQTADALADDLKAFLNGDPVEARRGQTLYRVKKRLRKHWFGITIASGMVALITGGSLYHLRRMNERNQAAESAYLEAQSLLATLVIENAKVLSEAGREDLAGPIALRALEFDWDLPIEAESEDPALNPRYLRMEVYALNGALALGYVQPEKATELYRLALAELEDWQAPPEMEDRKLLSGVRFRSNLLALDPTIRNNAKFAGFLKMEKSLRESRVLDRNHDEALTLRVELLRSASRVPDDGTLFDDTLRESFPTAVNRLETEFDTRLAGIPKNFTLETFRCVIADVRCDLWGKLGKGNLIEAEEAAKRWQSLHVGHGKSLGVGRKRVLSLGKLAVIRAREGDLDEATVSFESAGEVWESMNANQIFGSGTETEEELIGMGVELMGLCNPTRPELTLRVVEVCRPVFNFTMPKVHVERAIDGFIPPELWPIYAEGRKYEARAFVAIGNLDDAWGAYSGCSGRLGELCKMSPDEAEPLVRRCELLAEWVAMPAPPREPDHPKRVADFLEERIASAKSMSPTPEQQARLEALTAAIGIGE